MGDAANAPSNDTPQVLLEHHLKQLRLPTFLREYDKVARQCAAESADYPRYLLRLAESAVKKTLHDHLDRAFITWLAFACTGDWEVNTLAPLPSVLMIDDLEPPDRLVRLVWVGVLRELRIKRNELIGDLKASRLTPRRMHAASATGTRVITRRTGMPTGTEQRHIDAAKTVKQLHRELSVIKSQMHIPNEDYARLSEAYPKFLVFLICKDHADLRDKVKAIGEVPKQKHLKLAIEIAARFHNASPDSVKTWYFQEKGKLK